MGAVRRVDHPTKERGRVWQREPAGGALPLPLSVGSEIARPAGPGRSPASYVDARVRGGRRQALERERFPSERAAAAGCSRQTRLGCSRPRSRFAPRPVPLCSLASPSVRSTTILSSAPSRSRIATGRSSLSATATAVEAELAEGNPTRATRLRHEALAARRASSDAAARCVARTRPRRSLRLLSQRRARHARPRRGERRGSARHGQPSRRRVRRLADAIADAGLVRPRRAGGRSGGGRDDPGAWTRGARRLQDASSYSQPTPPFATRSGSR